MNSTHHAASRLVLYGIAGAAALISPEVQARTHVSVGVSIGASWPHSHRPAYCPPPVVYCPPPVVHCPPPVVHHYSHRSYGRGHVVRYLPSSSVCVTYGTSVYYRCDNVYYQPCSTGYIIVEPPPTIIYTSPAPVVYTTPAPVIYTPPAPVYQVVSQPAPTPVAAPAPVQVSAPAYRAIWVGPVEYEIRDGQFFRRTYEGAVWTEPPYGAVTQMLPVGHKSVWFKGVEFFECDKTYYRKTPEGYKVVPAPWI